MRTVVQEGLLGAGCTLAARLLEFPQFIITNQQDVFLRSVMYGGYHATTGVWIEYRTQPPDTEARFPYGFEVEPP